MVDVQRQDREAAARASHDYAMNCLGGRQNGVDIMIQAFAAHRIATEQAFEAKLAEAVEAERDLCAKVAEAQYSDRGWDAPYRNAGIGIASAIREHRSAEHGCVNHPTRPVREHLDGDDLCQECCDIWVRGEGIAAQERRTWMT